MLDVRGEVLLDVGVCPSEGEERLSDDGVWLYFLSFLFIFACFFAGSKP